MCASVNMFIYINSVGRKHMFCDDARVNASLALNLNNITRKLTNNEHPEKKQKNKIKKKTKKKKQQKKQQKKKKKKQTKKKKQKQKKTKKTKTKTTTTKQLKNFSTFQIFVLTFENR